MADADEGVKPANGKPETKLLDELENGPWPSFVTEIKSASGATGSAEDLLGQLELSYEDKVSHWKHGGLVGVLGYGGGVIGRYSDVGEQFPKVAHFPHHAHQSAGRLVLHQ
jgi:sulfite reductase alpha subunit